MQLSNTQKKVLCAINAYPSYSDKQLADVLKMKRATVTVARHYLQKNEFYETVLFPNYKKIGINLLAFKYGDYGKFKSIAYQQRMKHLSPKLRIEETVFSLSSELKGCSMFFSPNLFAIKEKIDAWNTTFEEMDEHVRIHDVYIPSQMVSSFKFMDSQAYLTDLLGVDVPLTKAKEKKKLKLSNKEKAVLLAWLRHPNATNEELSKKISVSRAIIGAIKKRLLDSGFVQLIQLPDWKKLGPSIGVMTYLRLNGKAKKLLDDLVSRKEVLFLISSDYEAIFFSLFENYVNYQQEQGKVLEDFKNKRIIIKKPEELVFPIQETKVVLNSLPLVEKLFPEKSGKKKTSKVKK